MMITETQSHRVHREYDGPFAALTGRIIAAAIEVHRHVGPGLFESVYEECLCKEFSLRGIAFQRQVRLPLAYKGLSLDCTYRMDLVVENAVVLELKAQENVNKVHEVQLLTYLRLSGLRVGLLINFHSPLLANGIVRKVL